MKHSVWLRIFIGIFAAVIGTATQAQTTAGSASVMVIPLVSHSASFLAEIFVRNPGAASLTLNVRFYDARSAPAPGLQPCTPFVVPAGQTRSFTMATQCTFDLTTSHFGMVILEDAASPKVNIFQAFARVQNPSGIGFSAEGFPIGNFSGAEATVLGLKRQAASPGYQSNCFVGALGEAVDYQVTLFDGVTNAILGAPITGSLVPFQSVRFLDVFAAAGLPAPGDHLNARADFIVTTATTPAMVSYCTVQENITTGADFRIAKSDDADDFRQQRLSCYGQEPGPCGTVLAVGATQIGDASLRNIHTMFIADPDFVKCDLVAAPADLAKLQMRLRVPGNAQSSPVFVPTAPYDTNPPFTAGGAGQTGFYVFTGNRSVVNGGFTARWMIDVEARTSGTAVPINYGITCTSGNGVSLPYIRDTFSAAVPF